MKKSAESAKIKENFVLELRETDKLSAETAGSGDSAA